MERAVESAEKRRQNKIRSVEINKRNNISKDSPRPTVTVQLLMCDSPYTHKLQTIDANMDLSSQK